MPITLDRRPKGRYPFKVFHTSLGPTLCTEPELKSDLSVGVLSLLVSKRFRKACLDASFQALPEFGWIKIIRNALLLMTAKHNRNPDRVSMGVPLSRTPNVLNIFEPKLDYINPMQFFILYPTMESKRLKDAGIRSQIAIYEQKSLISSMGLWFVYLFIIISQL